MDYKYDRLFMPIHAFPLELRSSQKDWAFMEFYVQGRTTLRQPESQNVAFTEHIYLPIPEGLTFSDGMTYSSINLGILGDIAAKGLVEAFGPSNSDRGIARKSGGVVSTMAKSATEKARQTNAAAAAAIAAKTLRQDNAANLISYGAKQVLNPNTRTTFESSNIRSFNFRFKMVGRTKADSDAIWRITQVFQQYMYPEGNEVIMKYPPTWEISFYDGQGNENPYIPGIYDCYLTNFTPTYNSSTNIFHEDGSPVEVDIELTFQETKALTRKDIVELNENRFTS